MRTFNVSLLTVLSCIAMISATPIGNRSPVEAPVVEIDLDIKEELKGVDPSYVALQQLMEILTRLNSFLQLQ